MNIILQQARGMKKEEYLHLAEQLEIRQEESTIEESVEKSR